MREGTYEDDYFDGQQAMPNSASDDSEVELEGEEEELEAMSEEELVEDFDDAVVADEEDWKSEEAQESPSKGRSTHRAKFRSERQTLIYSATAIQSVHSKKHGAKKKKEKLKLKGTLVGLSSHEMLPDHLKQ